MNNKYVSQVVVPNFLHGQITNKDRSDGTDEKNEDKTEGKKGERIMKRERNDSSTA